LSTVVQAWPRIRAQLGQQILRYRRPLIVSLYVVLIALGYWLSYELRFDFHVPPADWKQYLMTLPILLAVRIAPDAHFGVFRGYWRHSGLEDLVALCKAATLGSIGFVIALLALGQLPGVPRSVLVLEWVATIFLGGGLRALVRYIREIRSSRASSAGRRTLIIGAGDQADRMLREISLAQRPKLQVVGLVSGHANGRGRSLRGVRVLGGLDDIVSIVSRHRIEFVIMALDRPSGEVMQRAVAACVDGKVEFKTLPSFNELLDGFSRLDQLRAVHIEDLLGRAPVELDCERVGASVRDKVVLITGGAGSIGSELARQVARLRPARLLLLDQAESPLYFTVMELTEACPGLEIVPLICDITDSRNVMRTMLQWSPHYVIHAAAYKHVPMMEDNAVEAIRNNVFGTMHVATAAASCGAERFVLISTDKAVRPSSVMGATKRVAERLVMGLPNFQRSGVDFRAVRFGNVLGSAGSVVPVFNRQIAEGKPITVTHPDVERYFMTIPEAAQLVLEAGVLDEASRRVTMLDMGEPVRILDLAERLIRLAGLQPHRDVPIRFIGLRPGEKLREELMSESEATVATAVDKIRVVERLETDGKGISRLLGLMAHAVAVGDAEVALDLLCDLVPECVAPLSARRSAEHQIVPAVDGVPRVGALLFPTEAQAV
jgi:FlaA1/EpsC-like NDP-sugar epimerase